MSHEAYSGPQTSSQQSPEVQEWTRLQKAQDDAFHALIKRNQDLEKQCKQLEFDNWTLKTTLTASRDQFEKQKNSYDNLMNQLKQLETVKANISSAKFESPLVVSLIDGDGCIFSREYLKQGEVGGRKAAERLMNGITSYLRTAQEPPPAGVKIMAIIFLSKDGLAATLDRFDMCKPEEFTAFLNGFNKAHGLFSVVDCGNAKEAADHKIRDHLDSLIRVPQVFRVFFGGSHDNGYGGAISALQTHGFIDKLVILRSYSELAREIDNLNLPNGPCEIEDLFMKEKLDFKQMYKKPTSIPPPASPKKPTTGPKKSYNVALLQTPTPTSTPPAPPKLLQAAKPFVGTPKTPTPSAKNGLRRLETNTPFNKQNPPPCNAHYLGGNCSLGDDCSYGHDYIMKESDIEILRDMAANTPCRWENINSICHIKDCYMGHYCPKGPDCSYKKRGICKFKGEHMHDP